MCWLLSLFVGGAVRQGAWLGSRVSGSGFRVYWADGIDADALRVKANHVLWQCTSLGPRSILTIPVHIANPYVTNISRKFGENWRQSLIRGGGVL